MNKIIFFDIDGTLLGSDGKISDNVRKALLKTQENGNRICLASGRSKGGLPDAVADIPWDGYVLGNGSYGVYHDLEVMDERLDRSAVSEFINYTAQITGIGLILENNEGAYLTSSGGEIVCQVMKELQHYKQISSDVLLDYYTVIDDLRQIPDVNKIMYFGAEDHVGPMIEKFAGQFDFLPNSIIQGESLKDGEIMKKGITKAAGIQKMIAEAGYSQQDVIAFGDGYNDIEMIEFAGVGVAMGNGVEALIQKADIVADTHDNDGISHVLTILKLI